MDISDKIPVTESSYVFIVKPSYWCGETSSLFFIWFPQITFQLLTSPISLGQFVAIARVWNTDFIFSGYGIGKTTQLFHRGCCLCISLSNLFVPTFAKLDAGWRSRASTFDCPDLSHDAYGFFNGVMWIACNVYFGISTVLFIHYSRIIKSPRFRRGLWIAAVNVVNSWMKCNVQ